MSVSTSSVKTSTAVSISPAARFDNEIQLDSAVPGLAPAVAMQLRRSIEKGLTRVDEALRA